MIPVQSLVHVCVVTLAALDREMAGICDIYLVRTYWLLMRYQIWPKQSTVTHLAVCHDQVVNQQLAPCSGSPHDDNHLTSSLVL